MQQMNEQNSNCMEDNISQLGETLALLNIKNDDDEPAPNFVEAPQNQTQLDSELKEYEQLCMYLFGNSTSQDVSPTLFKFICVCLEPPSCELPVDEVQF